MKLYLLIVSILYLVTLVAGVVVGLLLRKRAKKWLKERKETDQILSANQAALYKELGKLKGLSQKQGELLAQIQKTVNQIGNLIQNGNLTSKLPKGERDFLMSKIETLREDLRNTKKQFDLFKEVAAAASLQSKGSKLGTKEHRRFQDQQKSTDTRFQ